MTRILAVTLNALGFGEMTVPGAKLRPSYEEPFIGNKLTSDEARFMAMQASSKTRPDLYIGAPTIGWIYQSLQAIDEIKNAPASAFADTRLLFCVAMGDKVVAAEATLLRARSLPQAKIVRLEGSEHEALMEKDGIRAEFWKSFDGFVG